MSRRAGLAAAIAALLVLSAAGTWAVFGGGHRDGSGSHGSMSSQEYALAVRTARKIQATVDGTFVGATAVATDGHTRPWATHDCPNERLVHVRLVWKADASFSHAGSPGGPPDGPRKALIIGVVAATGDICEEGASYRGVGAGPDETLLYGEWPARTTNG